MKAVKGVEIRGTRVVLKIKNCARDPDELLLRMTSDGKSLRISHEEFACEIKLKRLEYAILLVKIAWFARWCRETSVRYALNSGIQTFNFRERREALDLQEALDEEEE